MITFLLTLLATLFFFGLLAMILLVSTYNRLHGLLTQCVQAFQHVSARMQVRHELVRQMASIFAKDERVDRELLAQAAERNESAQSARQLVDKKPDDLVTVNKLIDCERELDQALRVVWRVIDAQTPAGGDEQLATLQSNIGSAQTRLDFARETYNDFVNQYNASLQQFPARLLSGTLKFSPVALFDVPGGANATHNGNNQ